MFSGPLTARSDLKLQMFGLVSIFLEDLPQLGVQLWVALESDEFSATTAVALSFSVAGVVFGVGKRIWLCLYGGKEALAKEDAMEMAGWDSD